MKFIGVSLNDYIFEKVNITKEGLPVINRSERIKELILKGLEKEQEEKLRQEFKK